MVARYGIFYLEQMQLRAQINSLFIINPVQFCQTLKSFKMGVISLIKFSVPNKNPRPLVKPGDQTKFQLAWTKHSNIQIHFILNL